MTSYSNNALLNALQSLFNATGGQIIELTKVLNEAVGTTATDHFMDAAHGIGHRIVHGHSLDYLPTIAREFGAQGVLDYLVHGAKDALSPHGMPIPFAKEISTALGMKTMTAVDWLCFNVGDVIAGGFSAAHSVHNWSVVTAAVSAGYMPPALAVSLAIGAGVKLGTGALTSNAITLSAGMVDISLFAYGLSPLLTLGTSYFTPPQTIGLATIAAGAFSGGVTAGVLGLLLRSETDEESEIDFKRISRMIFAGAVGGVCGVAVCHISLNPIAISSSSIGGYITGEWLYRKIEKFEWSANQSSDDVHEKYWFTLLFPDEQDEFEDFEHCDECDTPNDYEIVLEPELPHAPSWYARTETAAKTSISSFVSKITQTFDSSANYTKQFIRHCEETIRTTPKGTHT